jgi:hypothetical protein
VKLRLEKAAQEDDSTIRTPFDCHNYGETYMDLLVAFLQADPDLENFKIEYTHDPGLAPQYGTGEYRYLRGSY